MSVLQNVIVSIINHTADTLHITNDEIKRGYFITPIPERIKGNQKGMFEALGGFFTGIDFRLLCHLIPVRQHRVVCHCCAELHVAFSDQHNYDANTLVDKHNQHFTRHYQVISQLTLIDKTLYYTVTFYDNIN